MIWPKEIKDPLIQYFQNDSSLPILVLSPDGFIKTYNKAFEELINGTNDTIGSLIDDVLVINQRFEQITSQQGYKFERFLGSLKPVYLSSTQLHGTIITNDHLKFFIFDHYAMNENKIIEQMSQMNVDMSTLTRTLTKKNIALDKANKKISTLLNIDYLTQIYNRRYFIEYLNDYIQDKRNTNTRCIGFISADIDFFKKVNDTYGHAIGDVVLISFAQTLQKNLGNDGIVARIGGEEFSALVYSCNKSHLISLTENMRQEVENIHFEQKDLNITASFGVTMYKTQESVDSLLKRADIALYKAKETGRNRIIYM